MMAETGCISVMVGRAALGHPWLFDPAYEQLDSEGRAAYEARVVGEHLDLIEACLAPRDALMQMKKHLALYLAGRPLARSWRGELFGLATPAELRAHYERVTSMAIDGPVPAGPELVR